MALGEGGQRACLASFGGDQFDDKDPRESRLQTRFFNWFTFVISLGGFVGILLIVWIATRKGWDYGFGFSALLLFLGLLVFASGFPLYRHQKPAGSPITRMMQVLVAAFRKRNQIVHEGPELEQGNEEKIDVGMLPPSKGLRFLDKASIDYGNTGSWSLCTTTQVEETKIVFRLVPLIICSILIYVPNLLLFAFTVQQGTTMDTTLGNIHISPANIFLIPLVFQMVFLVAYDCFFVPFVRKFTGHPGGITTLQRIGVGFMAVIIASAMSAVVERKRLNLVEEHALQNSETTVPMSVFWLSWQFILLGVTDVTIFVGMLEFFNTEMSSGMKSMGTAITWCITGIGSWLGTFLVEVVNSATRDGGEGTGWVEGTTLNNSRLDKFYWLLCMLSAAAFVLYVSCACMYVYRPSRSNAFARVQEDESAGN